MLVPFWFQIGAMAALGAMQARPAVAPAEASCRAFVEQAEMLTDRHEVVG
jgi:hypothetical protein